MPDASSELLELLPWEQAEIAVVASARPINAAIGVRWVTAASTQAALEPIHRASNLDNVRIVEAGYCVSDPLLFCRLRRGSSAN